MANSKINFTKFLIFFFVLIISLIKAPPPIDIMQLVLFKNFNVISFSKFLNASSPFFSKISSIFISVLFSIRKSISKNLKFNFFDRNIDSKLTFYFLNSSLEGITVDDSGFVDWVVPENYVGKKEFDLCIDDSINKDSIKKDFEKGASDAYKD